MLEDKIKMLLDIYPLDELFDILDIEIEDVIEILVKGGHVQLPEFIETIDG
jgi:hypothetical protein